MTSTEIQTHDAEIVTPVSQPPATLMQQGVEKLRQHAELKAMAAEYAEFITKTGACPDIFKKKPLDATAAIIRGTALGFDPDGALEAFFVIHGKTGMYARAMIAVAENVGCRVWEEEASDDAVTWCGTRPGDDKVERVTWTMARAQKAGYTSNAKYKSNPAEMLRAKCQTELARIIAPGALMGLVSEVEKDEVQHTVRATAERTDRPKTGRGTAGVKAALEQAPVKEERWMTDPLGYALDGIAGATTGEALDKITAWAGQQNLPQGDVDEVEAQAAQRGIELGLNQADQQKEEN